MKRVGGLKTLEIFQATSTNQMMKKTRQDLNSLFLSCTKNKIWLQLINNHYFPLLICLFFPLFLVLNSRKVLFLSCLSDFWILIRYLIFNTPPSIIQNLTRPPYTKTLIDDEALNGDPREFHDWEEMGKH